MFLPPVLITVPAANITSKETATAATEETELKDSAMLRALDAVTEFLYRVFIKA